MLLAQIFKSHAGAAKRAASESALSDRNYRGEKRPAGRKWSFRIVPCDAAGNPLPDGAPAASAETYRLRRERRA